MSVDVVSTCMVLHRYDQRENGIVATKQWQIWVDDNYNDARMEKYIQMQKMPINYLKNVVKTTEMLFEL